MLVCYLCNPQHTLFSLDFIELFVYEKERKKSAIHWFIPKIAIAECDEARAGIQEFNPCLPHGQQRPNFLSHHQLLPRICTSNKRDSKLEPSINPGQKVHSPNLLPSRHVRRTWISWRSRESNHYSIASEGLTSYSTMPILHISGLIYMTTPSPFGVSSSGHLRTDSTHPPASQVAVC